MLKSAEAILLLTRQGYSLQALPLARTVFEATVNVLYAEKHKNREGEYQRLWDFRWHQVGQLIEKSKPLLNHARTPAVDQEIVSARSRHGWVCKTSDWATSDRNLRDRAQRIGLKAEYDLAYRWSSQIAHATLFGLSSGSVRLDGDLLHLPGYSESACLEALSMALSCLHAHVQLWANVFCPDVSERVADILGAIWDSVKHALPDQLAGATDK